MPQLYATLAQTNAVALMTAASFFQQGIVANTTFGTQMSERRLEQYSSWFSRSVGAYTIIDRAVGFAIWKKSNSAVRVYSVRHDSPVYAAGLRDGYLLAQVNGLDARSIPKRQLFALLYRERPLRIMWQNDGHTALNAAQLRVRQAEADAAQATAFRQLEHTDLARRIRRRLVADNPRDDLTAFLVYQHARGQPLSPHHLFLRYAEPCTNCGFRLLDAEQLMRVKPCCAHGACLSDDFMPQLEPLPPLLAAYLTSASDDLSHYSLRINSAVNIAAIGLSPSRAEGGMGLTRVGRARLQSLGFQGRLYRLIRHGENTSSPAK